MAFRIFTVHLILGACTLVSADELLVSPAIRLANGSMVFIRRENADSSQLLIHFHGDSDTVRSAFARSDLDVVLAVVNFPGLSTAYSKPFANDPRLFERIQTQAKVAIVDSSPDVDWQRITVSSFSAGYGAVREILKTPEYFEKIDGIVAADSIYAGLQRTKPLREVDEANMRDFLKFASRATRNKKTFVLSHSAQATPYASTTETADYLLKSLKMLRTSETTLSTKSLRQVRESRRGQFLVLGFDGTTGKEHMQHLHNIDLLWRQLIR